MFLGPVVRTPQGDWGFEYLQAGVGSLMLTYEIRNTAVKARLTMVERDVYIIASIKLFDAIKSALEEERMLEQQKHVKLISQEVV